MRLDGSGCDPIDPLRLAESLRHRGPDDQGVHREPEHGLTLVHTRLRIIDLSERGRQPLIDPQTGDALVFNGEIYNHVALRDELEKLGHRFHSRCDTEVLLRALITWGPTALDRIHGMYAFAWWQAREATLHLVRDPMGMKPLYWCPRLDRGGVAFASELRSLTAMAEVGATVDRRSLSQFMEFGYTFDEARTIIEGVHKLPPGHRLEVRHGLPGVPVRFFHPRLETEPASTGKILQADLHDTLMQVVAQHLEADVPVALLLSGGLDSSILAALASRQTRVHTLSYGFADSQVDEREHARTVADYLGTDHEEVTIGPDDAIAEVEDAAGHFDDLFDDWGLVSTRMVYRQCQARGIKVVLVGEGADELFGGYRGRFEPGVTASPWPLDARLFALYRRYIGRRHGRCFGHYRQRMHEHLVSTRGDLFAAIRLFETRDQLPNQYVMKVDKASMSVSVEARTPFLDERVARIAYRIPGDLLVDDGGVKLLLRETARRYELLPESILTREKFGAAIDTGWMDASTTIRDYARTVALDASGWAEPLGLARAMRAYFQEGRSGFPFPSALSIFQSVAWRLVLLNLWSRRLGVTPGDV